MTEKLTILFNFFFDIEVSHEARVKYCNYIISTKVHTSKFKEQLQKVLYEYNYFTLTQKYTIWKVNFFLECIP